MGFSSGSKNLEAVIAEREKARIIMRSPNDWEEAKDAWHLAMRYIGELVDQDATWNRKSLFASIRNGGHLLAVVISSPTEEGIAEGQKEIDMGALVFSIAWSSIGRILRIDFFGGEKLPEILGPVVDEMERLAAHAGCVQIEFDGRVGWQTVLAEDGYSAVLVRMAKQLVLEERRDE